MLSRLIRRLVPADVVYQIELPFREKLEQGRVSFAQEGEDLLLDHYFRGKKSGFYVDVGSHHPVRFSNTYYFYLKGWSGINIDPLPGSKRLFDALRTRDVNLEVAVSDVEGSTDYYMFDEPALNTLCPEEARHKSTLKDYHFLGKTELATLRLETILAEHARQRPIDFMSVDVEGLEMNVLGSNDWERFRPRIVLVELLRHSFEEVLASEACRLMRRVGYEIVSKTHNTLFFHRNP